MKIWNGLGALVLSLCFSAPSAAQNATDDLGPIVPHSAAYSLELLEASVGEVTSVEGVLTFDLNRTCTNWDSAGEMALLVHVGGAPSIELVNSTSFREALDASALEFSSHTEMDGNILESSRGIAQKSDDDGGVVRLTMPTNETIAMPVGTRFPIEAAEATVRDFFVDGERISTYFYFDGRPEGAVRATDLAAGTAAPISATAKDPDGLLSSEPLRLITTFFTLQEGDSIAGSTIIGDMLPNGVLSQVVVEVGFIKIIGTLTEVRANDVPEC